MTSVLREKQAQGEMSDPNTTPKRRRFHFSLRTLLVVVVLLSLPLAWFASKIRKAARQRQAVEAIRKAGGLVFHDDFEVVGEEQRPKAPTWLREWLGDDLLFDVDGIIFEDPKAGDEDLKDLKALQNLATLNLAGTQVTDDGLADLKTLTRLTALGLSNTQVTDAGLAALQTLPRLDHLGLDGTQVTDAGIADLKAVTRLRALGLSNTQLTDAGLAELKTLQHLSWLNLANTNISDAGLATLKELPNLGYVSLSGTQVTDEGVEELRRCSDILHAWK